MSDIYVFICTKTTADWIIPSSALSEGDFRRKVYTAFRGMVGGQLTAGDLKLLPTQAAVANHLLCNGDTIQRAQFPQLVDFLAGPTSSEATLPNYAGALTMPTPTVTQTTTDSGTVTTGGAVTDAGDAGGTTGGNIVSGGRPERLNNLR